MTKDYLKGSVQKSSKKGVYSIVASTASIDRQGDSIDQSGWDLKDFKANPVLIWAHDYKLLPIGKVTDIAVVNGKLKADFEFADADANPMAAQIEKLYEAGIVNASSVGFIPQERNGHIITRAQLLELSLVPVPANQDALRLAFESKSFDLIQKDFETKGEIADELNAEEVMESKYEKWQEVTEVLSAFYTVYFDEATSLEDFSKLLTESIALLQELVADDGADDDDMSDDMKGLVSKAISETSAKIFIDAILEKSGARLSSKTMTCIDQSISSMQESIKVLENLKSEDDQADTQAEKTIENVETEPDLKEVYVPLDIFLESIHGHLKNADKCLENGNKMVNDFLKSRKIIK